MELLDHLLLGFSVVLHPQTLLYCLIGVTLGTLVGVLPGIGPVATISVLLPITFYLPAIPALIMLAGIYYGYQYGGSTTSILVKVPGESASVVTCLDGYAMTRQGRAGAALAIAALSSFFAGCAATLLIALFAPPLAAVALEFGSPEYFSLMVLGLVLGVVLAKGSVLKATAMVLLGLLFGLVGVDVTSGVERFTFGSPSLVDGISFVVVALGLFGFAEVMVNLERGNHRRPADTSVKGLWPTRPDFKASWRAVLRGTGLGAALGILPGTGATISSFASYALEKRLSHHPERFGQGSVEGVAGPESANNAAAQTSFIPLLTLGIPGSATTAVMLGAMTIQGITPGPSVMTRNPDLFWGMIASMWVGNLMLVILNLPLITIWARLLAIPYRHLYPAILFLACIGIYSVNNNVFDVLLAAGFGVLGYVFLKLGCEPAPFVLAFILGPLMEEHLRRAMLLSRGDPSVFVTSPLSLLFLSLAAAVLLLVVVPSIRRARGEIVEGE